MVLVVLPILWSFTGLTAIATLYRVSSALGTMAMVFDNWKMKKLQDLGIPEQMVKPIFDEEEAALREMVRAMRVSRGGSPILDDEFRPMVIDFPHHDEDIAGRYAFVSKDEFVAFCDSVRHYNLSVGEGPEVDRLTELLKGTDIDIDQLSFLWNDYEPVFKKLRKLSAKRLKDPDFQKLTGMV